MTDITGYSDRGRAPRKRRQIARKILAVLVAVWIVAVVTTLGLAGLALVRARGQARSAEHSVRVVDLTSGGSSVALHQLATSFKDAHRLLSLPALLPLRFIPVFGRQLRSARALAGAASRGADLTATALDQAAVVLRGSPANGAERLDRIRRLLAVGDRAHTEVGRISLGPSSALIGPVASARAEAERQLSKDTVLLERALAAMRSTLALLDGRHQILLFADNNAEMRAGSGMALQVGTLIADNGRLALSALRPSADLAVPPGSVPVSGPLLDRWGNFHPTLDFRELFVAPRFDVTAPVAAEMWTAAGGSPVDAAMAIDPVFVQLVLAATGPVTVNGRVYDADNVLRELLHDQYLNVTPTDDSAESARRQALGSVAQAVFDHISAGGFSLSKLAAAMVKAAAGRHLMMWSTSRADERGWEVAGVDGSLRPSSILVSVLNRGKNKLDYFLPVSAELHLVPTGRDVEMRLVVHLENHTPGGEPQYVAGPNVSKVATGGYHGIIQVSVPGSARGVSIRGVPIPEIDGPDGPTWVIAAPVDIAAGASTDVEVTFSLPAGSGHITLEPAARVPEMRWMVGSRSIMGDGRHDVSWP